MKFFRNLDELRESLSDFPDNAQVWRGEDGSYAVGNTFPADVEEGETEYIAAGNIEEYRE